MRGRAQRGFILMHALWVLVFLAVLAVGAASGIRQKMIALEKFNQRSRMNHVLRGGVQLAATAVRQTLVAAGFVYTPWAKIQIHNNPVTFAGIFLDEDQAQISYTFIDRGPEERFGVVDEERKINVNYADGRTLQRLIERVAGLKKEDALRLAAAILDWRNYGESDIKGFWSGDYYPNLNVPYRKKDANYESLDELLLVEGMTKERYERLLDYITVYGGGRVNINTASSAVLGALGLEDECVEKILAVRRGKDGIDGSLDDHIFYKPFDVAVEVHTVLKLSSEQMRAIDMLNRQGILSCQSFNFSIAAQGHLPHSDFVKKVRAVLAAKENRIVYWKEK